MKTSLFQRPKHYWRNFALKYLGALFLGLFVIVPLGTTYFIAYPRRFPVCCNTPADVGLSYESVTFTAIDGVKLTGWYIPSKNGAAIIAVHANGGNRTGVLYHTYALARQGYGVLLFDLRSFGESEGCLCPVGTGGPARDVRGALAYLQQRADVEPERIGALGLSLGAMAVLRAAAEDQGIRAVLADGAVEDHGPPAVFETMPWVIRAYVSYNIWVINYLLRERGQPALADSARQIAPRPLLLISGADEDEQQDNRLIYASAAEPKQLWEMADTPHIEGILAHRAEYEAKMLSFFQQALLNN